MQTANIKQLKTELTELDREELISIILRLSKFKKENKELLTYLMFESGSEVDYIADIKLEVDEEFDKINVKSFFYIKKSVRKILKRIKTYIRYSNVLATEVELRLYFCFKLSKIKPSIKENQILLNLINREISSLNLKIIKLHEDLQYDFNKTIDEINTHL